jgi:hypothetical protein
MMLTKLTNNTDFHGLVKDVKKHEGNWRQDELIGGKPAAVN